MVVVVLFVVDVVGWGGGGLMGALGGSVGGVLLDTPGFGWDCNGDSDRVVVVVGTAGGSLGDVIVPGVRSDEGSAGGGCEGGGSLGSGFEGGGVWSCCNH